LASPPSAQAPRAESASRVPAGPAVSAVRALGQSRSSSCSLRGRPLSGTRPRRPRQSSQNSAAERDLGQAKALQALASTSELPLKELAVSLLAGVYLKDGGAAFPPELIGEVITSVMEFPSMSSTSTPANSRSCSPCPRGEEVLTEVRSAAFPQLLTGRPSGKFLVLPEKAAQRATPDLSPVPAKCPTGKLLVQVLRVLCERCRVPFHEAAGQVLFRNRRADVLRKRKDLRQSSEDLSWIAAAADPADQAALGGVEGVFRAMCVRDELRSRQWQKVVQLMQRNPVLASRVRHSDADRLFYEVTHRDVEATHALTSVQKFKELLALLSEAAGVHPAVVFISVGCHGQHLEKGTLSQCE